MIQLIKNPASLLLFSRMLNSNNGAVHLALKKYLLRKFVLVRKEYQWFKKIDALRHSGVYSDFAETLAALCDLTHTDFLYARKRLEKTKNICIHLILFTKAMNTVCSRPSIIYGRK